MWNPKYERNNSRFTSLGETIPAASFLNNKCRVELEIWNCWIHLFQVNISIRRLRIKKKNNMSKNINLPLPLRSRNFITTICCARCLLIYDVLEYVIKEYFTDKCPPHITFHCTLFRHLRSLWRSTIFTLAMSIKILLMGCEGGRWYLVVFPISQRLITSNHRAGVCVCKCECRCVATCYVKGKRMDDPSLPEGL